MRVSLWPNHIFATLNRDAPQFPSEKAAIADYYGREAQPMAPGGRDEFPKTVGPTAIAKALGIGRASVYRAL
jgi:hypothetical protein